MKPSSIRSQASIKQMGSLARVCLSPGQFGKVLAAFSKAVYLLTDANELFWITTEAGPIHQRCISIAAPLLELQVGMPFCVEEQRLIIDAAVVLDTEDASLWSSPPTIKTHYLKITELTDSIQSLFSSLDYSQAKGFGNFIPHILSLIQNSSSSPSFETRDPMLLFAKPFVMAMSQACLNQNTFQISQNADALIGLGSGLTPSGDDFLGGMLFAMKVLQAAYPNLNSFNNIIPIESYRSRTHLISFTLLKDLANGHAIAPLHQIINGLLGGKSLESIYPSFLQLIQVGHSTGWDLLAGLLAGLLTTCRRNYLAYSFQSIQSIEA